MNFASITSSFLDFPDNHSQAIIIYFYGCDFNCNQCHNFKLRIIDEKTSNTISIDSLIKLIEIESSKIPNQLINRIVLSGGDPLANCNIKNTIDLCKKLKKKDTVYEICIYTGNNIDFVKEHIPQNIYDYVKCGTYDETKRQSSHKSDKEMILSSTNQEMYYNDYERNILKKISIDGTIRFE